MDTLLKKTSEQIETEEWFPGCWEDPEGRLYDLMILAQECRALVDWERGIAVMMPPEMTQKQFRKQLANIFPASTFTSVSDPSVLTAQYGPGDIKRWYLLVGEDTATGAIVPCE